jgi:uncharacterized protein YbjT (DUF2867 family)
MNVLVTGGTGALGREVVVDLRSAGHRARVMSRKAGTGADWVQADLASGKALDRAVEDMEVVVHAATAAAQPWRLRATDVDGTHRLVESAARAHVKHFVFISVVGMEGVRYPYFRRKLEAEKVVQQGSVPWTILRASQFHTFTDLVLGAFSRVPGIQIVPFAWQFQPVDTRDVARRLTDLALGPAAGRAPDFGGPEVRTFKSLAESWLKARKQNRRLVDMPVPLAFSAQFAAGKLLSPDHKDGKVTFEQYLVRKYGRW